MDADLAIIFETDCYSSATLYAKYVANVCGCEVTVLSIGEFERWNVVAPYRVREDFYKWPEFSNIEEEEMVEYRSEYCPSCNGSGEVISFMGEIVCDSCSGCGEIDVPI
jgi:hypothetical protein